MLGPIAFTDARAMHASPRATNAYLTGATGSYVSRSAKLNHVQRIQIGSGTVVFDACRLDASHAEVRVGHGCVIGARSKVITTPVASESPAPLLIGDHVIVGEGCTIRSSTIGKCVRIGRGCSIGERCVLQDCCELAPNTVLPADSIVPPLTLVRGQGRTVQCRGAKLPASTEEDVRSAAEDVYSRFRARVTPCYDELGGPVKSHASLESVAGRGHYPVWMPSGCSPSRPARPVKL